MPDVIVAGCDPTGLLWRPFTGSCDAPWQVSGLADLGAHEKLLQRLCDDMDARIAALPLDRDTIEVASDRPLMLVVFEELAGLLRAADAADKATGKTIRVLLGRLLAEGHKVGMRFVILVQRAVERSDDEIAAEDKGGEDTLVLPVETWAQVREHAGELLDLVEVGAVEAACRWLDGRGLSWSRPNQGRAPSSGGLGA